MFTYVSRILQLPAECSTPALSYPPPTYFFETQCMTWFCLHLSLAKTAADNPANHRWFGSCPLSLLRHLRHDSCRCVSSWFSNPDINSCPSETSPGQPQDQALFLASTVDYVWFCCDCCALSFQFCCFSYVVSCEHYIICSVFSSSALSFLHVRLFC